MRKIPNIIRIGAIVSIAWFAAAALTPLTSVAIRNSTIDSTAIGGTTASTVRSTTLTATGRPSNPLSGNISVVGWNASNGGGEMDFLNDSGAGAGGFNWYATRAALGDSWSAPAMSLSASGTASANLFSGSTVTAQSQYGSTPGFVNGGWIAWNQSIAGGTGFGEMDFIAQHATGAGGFNWYSTTSPTNPGPAIASLDSSGNFFARSVTASAGLTGSLTGNASSANVLTGSVTNCGATTPATGIQTNGNANCGSYPFSTANPGFVTLPGGLIMQWGQTGTYDTGPISVNFAHTFPHACLNATVGSIFTGASRASSLVSCNTTSITVENNGSGISNYTAIGW